MGIFSLGKPCTRKDVLEVMATIHEVKIEQRAQAEKIDRIESMIAEIHEAVATGKGGKTTRKR